MAEEIPENDDDFEHEKIRRMRRAMYSRSLSRRLRRKPRRELDPIKHNVADEWQEEERKTAKTSVAPRGITRARTALTWVLIGSIAFFVLSAGVFVYYFTLGPGASVAAPGNIDINISGPLSVVGGEPAELQVSVVNRNQAALELADLVITYPEGTRSPSDFLTELPRQRISLGSIEPGGRRQGTVSAVFVGAEDVRETVHVELEYRVADSSAIFAAEKDFGFTFASAPIEIAIEGNEEAVSGQRVALTARVRSNVDTVLKDVMVEAEYPFGFTPDSVDPDPIEEGKAVWELGDIAAGDERIIRIRGRMEGQEGDERIFRFTAGTRKEQEVERIDVALAEGLHRVAVARPFIGLDIGLNKQSGTDPNSMLPGETITVAVTWTNNLSTAVTDAVLVANLSGIDIDGRTVRTTDGFYRSTDNTVLWDKSTTQNVLAHLSPGESGVVNFSFEVPPEEDLLDERNSALAITVHAAGKRVSQAGVPETLQATAKRDVKLASNVQFISQGFYYSNPFGSVGPLPPKVNQETTYALVFTVANTSNRLEDVKLTGVLPPYVRWIGVYSPSGENLEFSSSDGSVTWDIGSVAPGIGVEGVSPRQVAFAIGLTPSASQIGQEPPMIRNLRLTGYDTFIEDTFEREHPDVTTNLLDDPGFSTVEARVVEEDAGEGENEEQ